MFFIFLESNGLMQKNSHLFSSTQLFYSHERRNCISNKIIFQRGEKYSISWLCYIKIPLAVNILVVLL